MGQPSQLEISHLLAFSGSWSRKTFYKLSRRETTLLSSGVRVSWLLCKTRQLKGKANIKMPTLAYWELISKDLNKLLYTALYSSKACSDELSLLQNLLVTHQVPDVFNYSRLLTCGLGIECGFHSAVSND